MGGYGEKIVRFLIKASILAQLLFSIFQKKLGWGPPLIDARRVVTDNNLQARFGVMINRY